MPNGSNHIADSYLQHMLLAARVKDQSKGLWRNLFDNWHAYKTGHPFVTKGGGGQPRWFNKPTGGKCRELLLKMHCRSQLAKETIWERPDEIVAVDHMVPVTTMRDMMIEQATDWKDAEGVSRFLESWYRLWVVTVAEHRLLRRTHLNVHSGNIPTILRRYELAGIRLAEPCQ